MCSQSDYLEVLQEWIFFSTLKVQISKVIISFISVVICDRKDLKNREDVVFATT